MVINRLILDCFTFDNSISNFKILSGFIRCDIMKELIDKTAIFRRGFGFWPLLNAVYGFWLFLGGVAVFGHS